MHESQRRCASTVSIVILSLFSQANAFTLPVKSMAKLIQWQRVSPCCLKVQHPHPHTHIHIHTPWQKQQKHHQPVVVSANVFQLRASTATSHAISSFSQIIVDAISPLFPHHCKLRLFKYQHGLSLDASPREERKLCKRLARSMAKSQLLDQAIAKRHSPTHFCLSSGCGPCLLSCRWPLVFVHWNNCPRHYNS